MLTLQNLACAKGERPLFRPVDCTLEPGCWLHVTGANGIGKTSLLRVICGLAAPAAGEVRWQGKAIAECGDAWRQNLLYIGHDSGLQGMLSAQENLRMAAVLSGVDTDEAALKSALVRLGLTGRTDLPTRLLSQGQKRRAALARLVLSRAPVWVLDEPFVAVDGPALAVLGDLVDRHLAAGGLAVLTSHQAVDIGGRAPQVLELTR